MGAAGRPIAPRGTEAPAWPAPERDGWVVIGEISALEAVDACLARI